MDLSQLQIDITEALRDKSYGIDYLFPSKHLSIYRNNIQVTLLRTLQNIYPITIKLLGELFFNQTAKVYIHQFPATSGNLNDYGRYFPQFLGTLKSLEPHPYLSEIATFEWICHELYFVENEKSTHLKSILSIKKYMDSTLKLHPSIRLCRFEFPMTEILSFCQSVNQDYLSIESRPNYLFIKRWNFDFYFQELSQNEFLFLSQFTSQQVLSKVLQSMKMLRKTFILKCLRMGILVPNS